ncbi:MAG: hypothetical protein HY302_09070 [Opitutae bacterium]|nr:hypothetical protein [Opitutae bacterium]
MTTTLPAQNSAAKNRIGRAIFWGALISGGLDISGACIQAWIVRGAAPAMVLRGVAGAVLGASAAKGGWAVAALGLALHFTVATTATVVFCALSRRRVFLTEHAVLSGLAFGAAVFGAMNFVTLPGLGVFRHFCYGAPWRYAPPMGWIQFVIHLACVGLPIALCVRRFSAPAR